MKPFNLYSLSRAQKETRRRILEISHKSHLSHLGSCLSVVDLIDTIYEVKKKDEPFILSNGHAGIAWYVVLEKNDLLDKKITEKLHIHPDRNPKLNIPVSSGSLGQGLPIALGMALASPKKNIYCMISDGECAEGSIWETLRIVKDLRLNNLKTIVSANGWGAYGSISPKDLFERLKAFGRKIIKIDGHRKEDIRKALNTKNISIIFAKTSSDQFPFLKGQAAHYVTMKETDYRQAMEALS